MNEAAAGTELRAKVLDVDNKRMVAETLAITLKKGFDTTVAYDGAAFDKAESWRPDALVSDR